MDFAPLTYLPRRDHAALALSECSHRLRGVPQAREVVSGGRQGHLNGHFLQSASPELPHPALFFQHSEDRFNQRFAFSIDRSSRRTAQLPPHASVHRLLRATAYPPPAIEPARQVR